MKKTLLCSMAVMSLSVFATSPIYPQIDGVSEIDSTLRCVNNLEASSQVSLSQAMFLQTHIRNLKGYKVDKLINDTPKLKELSQRLLDAYGIDFNFTQFGISAKTQQEIMEHEQKAEIFAIYSQSKAEIKNEIRSVTKLINRNNYIGGGYGGFGFPGNGGLSTFPGGYGPNVGVLDIYYDVSDHEEESNVELQYNAYFNDFVVQSAADASDQEEKMPEVSSVITVKSVNYEITMTSPYSNEYGGWGIHKYKVVDADTGEEVINTQSPYDVCRKINAKKSHVEEGSVSTTELTPEKDGELILTGGAEAATVIVE